MSVLLLHIILSCLTLCYYGERDIQWTISIDIAHSLTIRTYTVRSCGDYLKIIICWRRGQWQWQRLDRK